MDAKLTISGDADWTEKVSVSFEAASAAILSAFITEARDIKEASQELVPVEDYELHDSARVVVDHREKTVAVTYSAPHAVVQHETPPDVYSHDEGRQWKYLEQPTMEATEGMAQRVAARARATVEGTGAAVGEAITFEEI